MFYLLFLSGHGAAFTFFYETESFTQSNLNFRYAFENDEAYQANAQFRVVIVAPGIPAPASVQDVLDNTKGYVTVSDPQGPGTHRNRVNNFDGGCYLRYEYRMCALIDANKDGAYDDFNCDNVLPSPEWGEVKATACACDVKGTWTIIANIETAFNGRLHYMLSRVKPATGMFVYNGTGTNVVGSGSVNLVFGTLTYDIEFLTPLMDPNQVYYLSGVLDAQGDGYSDALQGMFTDSQVTSISIYSTCPATACALPDDKKMSVGAIIGIVVGVFAIFLALLLFISCERGKRREVVASTATSDPKQGVELELQEEEKSGVAVNVEEAKRKGSAVV